MSITIHEHEVDNVTILNLRGRITIGEGSVTLRDQVRREIEQGKTNIVLDLGGVTYIDSSGLGELVSAFTTAKNRGATLKLLNLTKRVSDLMGITKLATVFDTYDDEKAAVESFRKN